MIRGTLIVDEFASELETDDVAVRDGVIGAVCERGLIGTQEDDGAGLVFGPGIVDIHTLRCAADVDCKQQPVIGNLVLCRASSVSDPGSGSP